jgi:lipopolysaccharide transport system ATP-binding protein
MRSAAIRAEGLAKRYRIGSRGMGFQTLRDTFTARSGSRAAVDRTLWALRDVSFEIEQGVAVGVVGSNGAGKTTLLKILSRVTRPTEGIAHVRGRVGSLLEVGTGFHPELTGRENVYLNGAILGMRRAEIAATFDEIVAFAEIERFIDTPVKRYSSGMYVRLAFAVAAHLDADILLVDEVLSVGDLAFQRKCLGKMQGQTAAEGRTVLFVSHNLASIKMLTEQCLWIDQGRVKEFGPTEEVFRRYVLSHSGSVGAGRVDLRDLARGRPPEKQLEQRVTFEFAELIGAGGRPTDMVLERDPFTVRTVVRAHEHLDEADFEVRARLQTIEGHWVFAVVGGRHAISVGPGLYETSFTVDPNMLRPGTYQIELYCLTRIGQDLIPAALRFRIEPNVERGDDPRYAGTLDLGLFRVDYPWTPLEPTGSAAGEELTRT